MPGFWDAKRAEMAGRRKPLDGGGRHLCPLYHAPSDGIRSVRHDRNSADDDASAQERRPCALDGLVVAVQKTERENHMG